MLFDKDEDGTITMAELGVVMRSLGQRPSGKIQTQISWENSHSNLNMTYVFKFSFLLKNLIALSLKVWKFSWQFKLKRN